MRSLAFLLAVDPAALHTAETSVSVFTSSGSASGGHGESSVVECGICSSGSGENPPAVNLGTSSLGWLQLCHSTRRDAPSKFRSQMPTFNGNEVSSWWFFPPPEYVWNVQKAIQPRPRRTFMSVHACWHAYHSKCKTKCTSDSLSLQKLIFLLMVQSVNHTLKINVEWIIDLKHCILEEKGPN